MRVILMKAALALAIVVACVGSSADAQTVVSVGDRPSCPACSAILHPVAALGGADDPAGFAPLVQVARNSRGEYVVSSPTFVGELFVYGSDGRFLRTVGRRGEGPGEFNRVQLLAFDALDSLHAVAQGGGRYSVLSPDLRRVARSANVLARVMAFRLEPGGTLYVLAPSAGSEGSRILQRLDGSGQGLSAFDDVDPAAGGQGALGRHLAVDGRGRRWSVEVARYRLTEWGDDGHPTRRLEAERSWIPQVFPERLNPAVERPVAQIGGLEVDDTGLLWLFVVVPDAGWRPAAAGSRPHPNDLFDTHIEVIDPGSGRLLAVGRSEQMVLPFQPGLAYSTVEDELGDLRVQVWRMAVTGR